MGSSPLDLPIKKFTFALIEPCPKATYFLKGQHNSSQPKNRAIVVFFVVPTDIGTDVSELIKIGYVAQM